MLTASSGGCGVSYQRIVETIADVPSVVENTSVPLKRPCSEGQRETDLESVDDHESVDEPRQFRRVRIRCREGARNDGCQDETKSGTIRCICGAQESLGLPEYISDDARSSRKAIIWLIQCVGCNVWQHRSCVETANGNDPPGGYYCGQCRKVKPIDDLASGDAEEHTKEGVDDSVEDDGTTVHRDRRKTGQHAGSDTVNIRMARNNIPVTLTRINPRHCREERLEPWVPYQLGSNGELMRTRRSAPWSQCNMGFAGERAGIHI